MADVAALAGCSQSTVSLILNNSPGVKIAEGTRQRVLEAVATLNYRVAGRRSPALASAGPVAIIFDDMENSSEALEMIAGARDALRQSGQLLLLLQWLDNEVLLARSLDYLVSSGASGVVLASSKTRSITNPAALSRIELPIVLLNCFSGDFAYPAIVPSEIAAGIRATKHLIDKGHTRVAIMTGARKSELVDDLLIGYRRALATADLAFDPDLVADGDGHFDSGHEIARRLLSLAAPPTAIFCCNHQMAAGCIDAIKDSGLQVPQHISVVGFGPNESASHARPALTSLQLPHREMGLWAMEQIRSPLRNSGSTPLTKLECQLVERDTVAPPPVMPSR
jgi:LacI family transcriptional regulator